MWSVRVLLMVRISFRKPILFNSHPIYDFTCRLQLLSYIEDFRNVVASKRAICEKEDVIFVYPKPIQRKYSQIFDTTKVYITQFIDATLKSVILAIRKVWSGKEPLHVIYSNISCGFCCTVISHLSYGYANLRLYIENLCTQCFLKFNMWFIIK